MEDFIYKYTLWSSYKTGVIIIPIEQVRKLKQD